jgi:hypothetical protein
MITYVRDCEMDCLVLDSKMHRTHVVHGQIISSTLCLLVGVVVYGSCLLYPTATSYSKWRFVLRCHVKCKTIRVDIRMVDVE